MNSHTALSVSSLNWIDYTIIALIGLSVLVSLIRGFVRETLSLVTWLVAFLLGLNFANDIGYLFAKHVPSAKLQFAIGFVLIFLATLLVGAIINYLISSAVKKTGLSGTDRVFGIVLGGVRGVLVVAIAILLAGFTSFPKDPAWQNSLLIPHFQNCANWLQQFVPNAVNFVTGI